MNNILLAFLLTLIAGLSTTLGGLITLTMKKSNKSFLSISLGFSAGVMIYISFVEILQNAISTLSGIYGEQTGNQIAVFSFFAGIAIIALIDFIIPETHNLHEIHDTKDKNNALMRMGLMSALAITIHNFPEGIATFITALQDPKLALPIVIAIALHNIPEGIAIAAPIYHATGSKGKALIYSALSGLAEPLGAIIGYLILMPFLNDTLFAILYSLVAGIMVFISLDELLPAAKAYGKHHLSIFGLILGMVFIAISLLML